MIPGVGRSPGEGNGYLNPVFLLGEFHRQKSLAGYSPGGVTEEWDTTEVTNTFTQMNQENFFLKGR